MNKPKKRSALRLLIGKIYYNIRRQLYWHFSRVNFATDNKASLPCEITTHQTILMRPLMNVEPKVQENKIVNLRLATEKLDKIIIQPSQTLSCWRQIGKPTKEKGYLEGMVLNNGNVGSGIGGGLCQLSNLIYWMTLHTPLTVVERWRHSYDVFPDVSRTQPFGSGATCSYPNIDLQIHNNTNQPFQLSLQLTNEHLVGKWLSNKSINHEYKIVEKDHKIEHASWGGYIRSNNLFCIVSDKSSGKFIAEKFITKNCAVMMYEPLLESER